jgi:two-component system response regulator NreC
MTNESKPIRVAILDDHQTSLDSYTFRLQGSPNIQVVATANYGNDLAPMLEANEVDVLLLDVNVPNSEEDRNPYPLLALLPEIIDTHPEMHILVISMYDQRTLVKAVIEAGATGYILKEDREAIQQLAEAVTLVNTGGVYLSKQLRDALGNAGVEQVPLLSKRQREALSLAAAYPDIKTEELGDRLNVAPSTLRNLLSKAYKRLNVRNRVAATEKARRLGLITPKDTKEK